MLSILTIYRAVVFFGGFGRTGTLLFNWHPVLAAIGVLTLITPGVLSWGIRDPDATGRTSHTKVFHAVFTSAGFLVLNAAVAIAIKSHMQQKIANFTSLHSWMGILTIALMKGNIAGGFGPILFPALKKVELISISHRLGGVAMMLIAYVTMALGFAEQQSQLMQIEKNPRDRNVIMTGASGFIAMLYGIMLAGVVALRFFKGYKDESTGNNGSVTYPAVVADGAGQSMA